MDGTRGLVKDFWWSIGFVILDCLLALNWRGETVAWFCLLSAVITGVAAIFIHLLMQE